MCIENCPVHTRTDVREEVQEGVLFRTITYVGDKCVVTMDNPKYGSPEGILAAIFGQEEDIPKMFETLVVRVGDGPLINEDTPGSLRERVLFTETHADCMDPAFVSGALGDEWLTEQAHSRHDMVVEGVKSGLIAG